MIGSSGRRGKARSGSDACHAADQRPPPRRDGGFTLIETLVTLTLVGLMLTSVPVLINGLASLRHRAAVNDVMTELRATRSQALLTGAPAALILDTARRGLLTDGGREMRPLPAVVERVAVEPAGLADAAGIVRLRFLPDGAATPVRLTLVSGGQRTRIRVDRLTGRVDRDD